MLYLFNLQTLESKRGIIEVRVETASDIPHSAPIVEICWCRQGFQDGVTVLKVRDDQCLYSRLNGLVRKEMFVWLLYWAKWFDQMTSWVDHMYCSCWWEWGRPELVTDVVLNIRTGWHHQFCTETVGLSGWVDRSTGYHQQSYGNENLVGRWSNQVRWWILRGSSIDPCGIPVERKGFFLTLSLHCCFKIPVSPLLCEGGLKEVLRVQMGWTGWCGSSQCQRLLTVRPLGLKMIFVRLDFTVVSNWDSGENIVKFSWMEGKQYVKLINRTELLGCKQTALYSNEEWLEGIIWVNFHVLEISKPCRTSSRCCWALWGKSIR